jgi:hypothetical protein
MRIGANFGGRRDLMFNHYPVRLIFLLRFLRVDLRVFEGNSLADLPQRVGSSLSGF